MGAIIGDRACWPTDRVGLEAGDDAVGQRCSICNSTRLIASSSSFSADMEVRSVCRSRCSSRSLGFSRTSRRMRARVRGRSVKRLGCVIGSTADLIAQNRSRRCSPEERWLEPLGAFSSPGEAAPSGRHRLAGCCNAMYRALHPAGDTSGAGCCQSVPSSAPLAKRHGGRQCARRDRGRLLLCRTCPRG